MQFRIADTFTDSFAKLTGDEQKAVKTAAFDLQMNRAHPGLELHQVDRAKDKDFWSVRVSRDIRLIVHRTASSFLLCYVDHHDAAYQWAERRRLERHPRTGAAQLVEIRETVREIRVPRYVEVDVPASTEGAAAVRPAALRTTIFADSSDDDLLDYGVPVEWLKTCGPRRRTRCSTSPIICPARPPRHCCSLPPAVPLTARRLPWRAPIRSRIRTRSAASG